MQVSVASAWARDRQDKIVAWFRETFPRRWDLFAFGALLLVAFGLRFWDLGARALHHDESLHAQFSWYFQQGRGYNHDPLMHGPFQFNASALSFVLFGASDYTARIPAAFFGTAMVALPFFLRGYLGRVGAFIAAAFIAFSPTILYFSRFTREDIYTAFWTLAIVVCIWRYLAEKRNLYLYLTGAFMALSFATKETTYMTVAIFLAFLEVMLTAEFVGQIRRKHDISPERTAAVFLALLPTAWLAAIFWPLTAGVRSRWGLEEFPAVAGLLIVMGTLAAPQYAGGIQSLGDRLPFLQGNEGYNVAAERDLRNVTVSVLLVLSLYVGLMWNPKVWLIAAVAFYVPYVLLFTTFFSNPAGFWSGIWGSIDYWIEQQGVRRGDQPGYYYFILMPLYEFLPLAFAVVGAVWYAIRGTAFTRFLVFWALGSLLAFTMAAEKMPWLNVHIALPVAILGGVTINDLYRRFTPRIRLDLPDPRLMMAVAGVAALLAIAIPLAVGGGVGAAVIGLLLGFVAIAAVAVAFRAGGFMSLVQASGIAVGAFLLVLSVRAAWTASFEFGDIPREMLVYTQTSPDVPRIADEIAQVAEATGQGRDIPIVVDATDGFSWPWAWYLRDYRNVSYPTLTGGEPPTPGAILLVAQSNVPTLELDPAVYGEGIEYKHRWWFPEAYRNATVGGFLEDLFTGDGWGTWRRYFVSRVPPGATGPADSEQVLGSVNATAFFPIDYEAAIGQEPVEPTPPATPRVEDDQIIIGGTGRARGQFTAPAGLALDGEGNLFVADSQNHRIQKFDSEGQFLDVWGTAGGGEGQFNEPWGIAVDGEGNIYVADTWNHRIQKFDANLEFVTTWGGPFLDVGAREPEPLELFGPRDIAIDGEGSVWVTDTGNKRVLKFSPDGDVLGAFGREGTAPGEFREPVGIAVGPDGNIYVADAWNQRIQRFDSEFNYLGEIAVPTWGSEEVTAKPYLSLMSNGDIVASDPANGTILLYSGEGELLGSWQLPELPGGIAGRPVGIVVSSQGDVYVSDAAGNEVRRLPISTIMGS
jgi:uncharacterized protein (TIGR03663 family)